MRTTTLIRTMATAVVVLASALAIAQDAYDFALTEDYLKWLADKSAAQVTIAAKMSHRTKDVHALASDCEMHLAGKPTEMVFGNPASVVVEPPYLCKFKPKGAKTWPALFDQKVMNRDCQVTGFPRIFTEHAKGGENPANPNHVFEIHPAMAIACDGEIISFAHQLTYFKGMRAIKPSSADNCVDTRELWVRYARGKYQFKESGGRNCGNFALIEVGYVEPEWVRKIEGGHTAIARVSLDGKSRTTLKLYTLEPSKANDWLAGVQASGIGDDRIFLHGMFTYDYFSIVKTLRAQGATVWEKPSDWKKVDFPVALVVFGRSQTGPAGEH